VLLQQGYHVRIVNVQTPDCLQGRDAIPCPAAAPVHSVNQGFIGLFSVCAKGSHFRFCALAIGLKANLGQLFVVAPGPGFVFLPGHRPHRTVRYGIVLASANAHLQVEEALKVVYSF